jgi:3-oxoadipate enol-lactonase
MTELLREGLRLHYEVEGPPGAPWLVMLNSLGTDLTLWNGQVRELARSFRVLRFDVRGHGTSTAMAGEYAIDQLGADVLSLLDELAIERAHLCGISLGGLTAQWLASYAAPRVERLVLSNTAARIGSVQRWQERMDLVREHGLAPLLAISLERWFTPHFRVREPLLVEEFGRRLLATDAAAYVGCCAALRDADLRPQLASIRAQTLVIAGTHDLATTPAEGRELASSIASARLVELPAAHLSNLEAAGAFTALVSDFLR